jgi:hypothetical protein
LRRAEWAKSASNPHRYAASGEPQITLDKINKVTLFSCVTNCARSPELREAYARLVTDELGVRQGEICINGSKSVQRSGCACGSLSCSGLAPRGDSNLRLECPVFAHSGHSSRYLLLGVSRRTSVAGLSDRSPMKTVCRNSPSEVQVR